MIVEKAQLVELVRPAIEDIITRAAQEEMDKIMADVENRVRERLAKEVAGIAINLMEFVRVDLNATELIIRVELPKKEG